MSFYAFDSSAPNSDAVHIDDWLASRTTRGKPICGCCSATFTIVAANSLSTSAHFAHPPGAVCHTIGRNAVPYDHLKQIPRDTSVAQNLRKEFGLHVEHIFNKCSGLAKNLSFKEFVDCFDEFHKAGAWEYHGLTLEYIPYLLLCFRDIFKARPPYRDLDFYFLLEPRTNLGDLWIRPQTTAQRILQVYPSSGRIVYHQIMSDIASTSPTVPTGFARTASSIRSKL